MAISANKRLAFGAWHCALGRCCRRSQPAELPSTWLWLSETGAVLAYIQVQVPRLRQIASQCHLRSSKPTRLGLLSLFPLLPIPV